MARPRKIMEEPMQSATIDSKPKSYDSLFGKIDNLKGKDRLAFTKSLTTEEKKAYVNHNRDRDCEMVTGVFRCHEPAGGMVEMTAMAHGHENPTKYTFYDGETYTVPKYIAKRFESEFQGQGTWYPTNAYLLDDAGKPLVHVGKKNRRFGFSSLEFQ